MAAERFVGVGFAQHDQMFVAGEAVRMLGEVAATDADGMYLRHILCRGHKVGHRTERLARIVHVETGHDHPYAAVGQLAADLHEALIEELRFVDSHHVDVAGEEQNVAGRFDRGGADGIGVVGDHILLRIAHIDGGLENFYFQVGELGSFESSDQLFGFARKHRSADYLYPTCVGAASLGSAERGAIFVGKGVFRKHGDAVLMEQQR